MKFEPLPRLFPDQPLWGAIGGPFTFVISRDEDGFTATAKTAVGDRQHEIGGYCAHKTLAEAQAACRHFLKNRNA
jgi:hypothetical protein